MVAGVHNPCTLGTAAAGKIGDAGRRVVTLHSVALKIPACEGDLQSAPRAVAAPRHSALRERAVVTVSLPGLHPRLMQKAGVDRLVG